MPPIKHLFKKLTNMFTIKKSHILAKENFNNSKLEKYAKTHSIIKYDDKGYIQSIDNKVFIRPKIKTKVKPPSRYPKYGDKIKEYFYTSIIPGILLILLQTSLEEKLKWFLKTLLGV